MNGKWRILALMTGAQAGASVVQQALGSLSPALESRFALSDAQLGVVFTALMLGSTTFTAAAGAMTDRWGERRMLLTAGATMVAGLLAATLFASYPWLVCTMAIFGAGYAASTPAGGRAILAWFDRDRGFTMGIRQAGVPLGGTIGALSLPAIARHGGYREAFVFAALLVAVTTLVAFIGYREAGGDRGVPHSLPTLLRGMRELVRDRRLIAVTLTCMILVAVQLAMNAFITITAVKTIGTTAAVGALAFALAQAMAVVGRLWWGYASDQLFGGDRLVPLAILSVLAAVASGVFAFIAHGAIVWLFAASALLGFAGAGWNGLMAAAMAEVGGLERAASALGLALTAIYGASAVAPFAFGALADATSLQVAWGATALLALIGVAPVLRLRATLAQRR